MLSFLYAIFVSKTFLNIFIGMEVSGCFTARKKRQTSAHYFGTDTKIYGGLWHYKPWMQQQHLQSNFTSVSSLQTSHNLPIKAPTREQMHIKKMLICHQYLQKQEWREFLKQVASKSLFIKHQPLVYDNHLQTHTHPSSSTSPTPPPSNHTQTHHTSQLHHISQPHRTSHLTIHYNPITKKSKSLTLKNLVVNLKFLLQQRTKNTESNRSLLKTF